MNMAMMAAGPRARAAAKRALDIEALLIWAYRDQLVDRVVAAMAVGPAGAKAIDPLATAGGGGQTDVHPDALTVHNAVMAERDDATLGLVIYHARTGSRPDAMLRAMPKLGPVRRPNGKVKVEYAPGRNDIPLYCPLIEIVSIDSIEGARIGYLRWVEGVLGVMMRLERIELESHEITEFKAPRTPWL